MNRAAGWVGIFTVEPVHTDSAEENETTLTAIDDIGALIIFDQQQLNRYDLGRGLPTELTVPLPDVIARTADLAGACRARDWPVAHAKVPNAHGTASAEQYRITDPARRRIAWSRREGFVKRVV